MRLRYEDVLWETCESMSGIGMWGNSRACSCLFERHSQQAKTQTWISCNERKLPTSCIDNHLSIALIPKEMSTPGSVFLPVSRDLWDFRRGRPRFRKLWTWCCIKAHSSRCWQCAESKPCLKGKCWEPQESPTHQWLHCYYPAKAKLHMKRKAKLTVNYMVSQLYHCSNEEKGNKILIYR